MFFLPFRRTGQSVPGREISYIVHLFLAHHVKPCSLPRRAPSRRQALLPVLYRITPFLVNLLLLLVIDLLEGMFTP
jgi:hypothetical protein